MPTPLPAEERHRLSKIHIGFEESPRLQYLAERKLLAAQNDIDGEETESPLTGLRRAVFGLTRKEEALKKRQDDALIPFEQEQQLFGQLQAKQKFLQSLAPPIGAAQSQYGIVPNESQLMPAPDIPVYGPGAPMATGMQPGQGFTPQELAQPGGSGAAPGQFFQQQYDQRARPYFEEGQRPQAMQLNPDAPLLPYQTAQLDRLMSGHAVMQDGRFVPTPIARASSTDITGEEANRQANTLRQFAAEQGVTLPEIRAEDQYAQNAKVNRPGFEAHQNQLTELAKKRLESRQNQILNVRASNLSTAQSELLALPKKEQTFSAAGRIARPYAKSGVTPEEVFRATKNPNAPLSTVNLDMSTKTAEIEFTKSTRETYDKLKHGPTLLDNIDQAKKLIPGAKSFMGPGGETLLEAAKFLNNRLGTEIKTEGIKSAEELRTRIFFNIMENLKKMDAQPSQMQQLIMMESLGKLGTDPNAMGALLDAFGDQIRAKIRLHNAEVQGAEKKGTTFPYDPRIKLGKSDVDAKMDEMIRLLNEGK